MGIERGEQDATRLAQIDARNRQREVPAAAAAAAAAARAARRGAALLHESAARVVRGEVEELVEAEQAHSTEVCGGGVPLEAEPHPLLPRAARPRLPRARPCAEGRSDGVSRGARLDLLVRGPSATERHAPVAL